MLSFRDLFLFVTPSRPPPRKVHSRGSTGSLVRLEPSLIWSLSASVSFSVQWASTQCSPVEAARRATREGGCEEGLGPRPWLVVNDGHKNYSDHKDPPVIVHTHTCTCACARAHTHTCPSHTQRFGTLRAPQHPEWPRTDTGKPTHKLSQLHWGTATHDHTRPRQAAERNATASAQTRSHQCPRTRSTWLLPLPRETYPQQGR